MLTPDQIQPPFQCQEIELEGRPIYVPVLAIEAMEEEMILSYFNSLVRLFPDPYIDHVEVKAAGKLRGIRLPHSIIDQCVEYEFPRRWDPLIDEQTLNWLTQVEGSHLEEELDGFDY